ncbi:MAG: hypothetical protein IIU00_02640 [Clostridia bacterium]|nr:hypothetical protein [Clostridia bacterium]
MAKKEKADDRMQQRIMAEVDKKFREMTQHGEKSLTVFRGGVYQMADIGDSYCFVEVPGYLSEDCGAIDPAAVYHFEKLAEMVAKNPPLHRKWYLIRKADIVGAEIGGRYSGFFDRQCGYLRLTYHNGNRLCRKLFYLPGVNNQFMVRDFLGDIPVTIASDERTPRGGKGRFLDRDEPSTLGAVLRYFNRKTVSLNRGNWLLSMLSLLLTVVGAIVRLPYGELLRGAAALMPLVIYLRYLRHRHLLSLLVTGMVRQSSYGQLRPGCFGKIAIPTVALLMTEVLEFGRLASFRRYAWLAFATGFILTLLYDFLIQHSSKERVAKGIICAAMCFFYGAMVILPLNGMRVTRVDSRVLDFPASRAVEEVSQGQMFHYCDVHMTDGDYRIYITDENYERLKKHELSARADKYKGLLGIEYYELTLVEARTGDG